MVNEQVATWRVDQLALKLRRRQVVGSKAIALVTATLMRELVAQSRFNSFKQLVRHLQQAGDKLQASAKHEAVISATVRRVIKMLCEEYDTAFWLDRTNNNDSSSRSSPAFEFEPPTPAAVSENAFTYDHVIEPRRNVGSFLELLGRQGPSKTGLRQQSIAEQAFDTDASKLKPVLLYAIQEFIDEVQGTEKAIGDTSFEFLHSGELILTLGYSKTVLAFLKNAHRKRSFTVLVAESAPRQVPHSPQFLATNVHCSMRGRQFAADLSALSIPTVLVPDSNVLALLPRCSKAVFSPHLVLADGSLIAPTGSYPLALAAKRMRIPVVIVAGTYKFCPSYDHSHEEGDPSVVFDTAAGAGEVFEDKSARAVPALVKNPTWDRVPTHLVDLYISNVGGHPSALIGRLMNELYGSE